MRARTPSLAAFYVGRPLWHASSSTSSFARWCLTRFTGGALLHVHADPLLFPVCDTTLELARLCAQFSTYRDVDGVRPTVDPSGLPSPSTPPLPQSPSPTTATRGAHQAEHHSMSIATQRTKARLKPNRRTTRTTTHGLFSSTTAPSVLSRRLRCSRRPEPHTAVEVAVVSWQPLRPTHPSQSLHRSGLTVHGNIIRVLAGCRLIFRPQTILIRRRCISTARRALLNSTWRCRFLLRRLRVSKPRGGRFRFSPPRARCAYFSLPFLSILPA
ncbi:hypothetical protein DFH09DRAFT_1200887 [Mycena vulgaris]|nr:hypothetical protein DFH09DRAFT_1200887 [Mycena vulgaris]